MDLNKLVKRGLVPEDKLPRDRSTFPAYYHWERVNMPTFMANSGAWKRRKVLKGNWSKP